MLFRRESGTCAPLYGKQIQQLKEELEMTNVHDLELVGGEWNDRCGYMNRKLGTKIGIGDFPNDPGCGCQIVSWSTNTIDNAYDIVQPA